MASIRPLVLMRRQCPIRGISSGIGNWQALSRICAVLIMATLLALGIGILRPVEAIAATVSTPPTRVSGEQVNGARIRANLAANIQIISSQIISSQTTQLPLPVANRLHQDLSQRAGIPVGKLRILEASPKTWPNGCLGLARPDEICSQALIEGWRVVLTGGDRRWVYRTDRQGRLLRLEMPPK